MSVNFWIQAELFYETATIIISIIVLLIIIAAIFVKTNNNKKVKTDDTNRNKIFKYLLLAASFIAMIGFIGHLYYQSYLDEVSSVNALIRDRHREFFGYVPYSTSEQDYYRNLNHLEPLRESELYKETEETLTVEFLGIDNTLHFFENENGVLFQMSQIHVEYVDGLDSAQLVGSQFQLVNSDFEEIGFRNPPYIMFERLEIPENQKDKTFKPNNPNDVHNTLYAHPDWVF